ncbi:putative serine/arginine repetitive matrix protein 1-like [Iris pallida]|uniref:Serine/arginine repetitive matrix protein 1-like n=1 Tax=Iris pallida TaxID=29817 RepID=A0AAX6G798_IRIPA|nr:putative serine/arginine repetitive matrix protein 1-like [Iris pallida]KAJ6824662.1 putative serine/arginine repetitive matrix protein 1-like [Iris pallida]
MCSAVNCGIRTRIWIPGVGPKAGHNDYGGGHGHFDTRY